MQKDEMGSRLEAAFRKVYSENRGPDGKAPEYAFQASVLSADGADFDLTVTFGTGRTFCCEEPGCHFSFRWDSWQKLRAALREAGWEPARRMRIPHFAIEIEAGAWMTDAAGDRCHASETEPHVNGSDLHEEPEGPEPPPRAEPRSHSQNRQRSREEWERYWQERRFASIRRAEADVAKAPSDSRVWRNLAHARWAEDKEGTIEALRRAVELAPGNLFVRGSLAQILRLSDRHDAAAGEYSAIGREQPDLVWPVHFRGLVELERGRFAEAAAAFDEALRRLPSFIPPRHRRAEVQFRTGHFAEALSDLEGCLERDPGFRLAERQRLAVLCALGRWEEALSAADAMAQGALRGPSRLGRLAVPLLLRGRILLALDRPREALRDLDSYLSGVVRPGHPWLIAARAHRSLGELAGEREALNRAVSGSPKNAACRIQRALFRARTGDAQGSSEDATEAVRLRPGCRCAGLLLPGPASPGMSPPTMEEVEVVAGSEFPEDLWDLA